MLFDTNVIIEAYRTGCWSPLTNYFSVHTVEKVVEETQTGFQKRDPEEVIPEADLNASLAHVEKVTDQQRAQFNLNYSHPSLDPGERDLLIYADSMSNVDLWLLNSPDLAAMRFAHRIGCLDRLVSLEAMNSRLRVRLRVGLRTNYTEKWLTGKKTDLLLGTL